MCDTVVVLSDNGVLFAKNSDRDPNEAQVLEWHPGVDHAAGSQVACTHISISQAPHTHAIAISRPFWMWGAEMGANEHGVAIGNEAVFTRVANTAPALTGMDLLRLALERSTSADDACQTIVTLLEEHGQGGACGYERRDTTYHNSFLIADSRGASVLETAGISWAVERVDGVRGISNGLTIPGFREKYEDRIRTRVAQSTARRRRTESCARGARGAGDLFATLRDHGEGVSAPRYGFFTGAMGAPCMHAGGLIAASQTTSSWVADLGGGLHWVTGTSAPCVSLYKPIRVAHAVDVGPAPGASADDSLWWRHERFHRAVMRDFDALLPEYAAERDSIEAAWLAAPPSPAEAFRRGSELLAPWTERTQVARRDRRPWHVRGYWKRRDCWAGFASGGTR